MARKPKSPRTHAPQRSFRFAPVSLIYLAGCLLLMGVALVAVPDLALQLLGSTVEYGTVLPRALGLLLMGVGIFAGQLSRYRADDLYLTTVGVHCLFLVGFAWLYWISRDPFFLAIFGIVAVGVVLTAAGLMLDRLLKRG